MHTCKPNLAATQPASFDTQIGLDGHYFHCIGQTHWDFASQNELELLLKSASPPEYRTILGIQSTNNDGSLIIENDTFSNNWREIRYSGPLYFDLDDADDLENVCDNFKQLLTLLVTRFKFDLSQTRLFATGGKGFHIEIPQQCFIPKVSPKGYLLLPYIYLDLAHFFAFDTMDFGVYSGKRGRMWRVPNRQRSNGMYKVPLTVDEALSITPKSYLKLVNAPRSFPELSPPTCNTSFAVVFDRSKDKVVAKHKHRSANPSKLSHELCKRFKGSLPPSVEAIASGKIPSPEGFNKLAMQLCLAALAVGYSLEDLIQRCDGLCLSHSSDGNRYNTPQKRRQEIARMYAYLASNSSYEFSMAGLRSILPRGYRALDLRGL